MKKEKFLEMETTEANIELNKLVNEDNKITYKKRASSSAEANIAIQEEFYTENNHKEALPTHVNYNALGFKITDKEN
ncbi:hypothetical protein [Psychrobacillus sp. BM2]|uniref:hypothetical protein n=1 Tax=Psychrobacillus sp. BM2 TaxID=3400421 RepID=UPI003B024D85